MGAVRDKLRAATSEIHEALHRAGPFARIEDGTIGRAGYGALLQMLHRYHHGMEAACVTAADVLDAPQLGLAQRNRVLRLEDDLAVLGLGAQTATSVAVTDPDFATGCLYTVLGSTLGGKVIFRQLESLLPDGQGGSFFRGTPEDGANWQAFCAALENFAQGRSAQDIEAGAQYAFARFQDLLAPARARLRDMA